MQKEYIKKKDKLQNQINAILKTKKKIEGLSIRKDEIQVKFDKMMPETCILCGNKIKKRK